MRCAGSRESHRPLFDLISHGAAAEIKEATATSWATSWQEQQCHLAGVPPRVSLCLQESHCVFQSLTVSRCVSSGLPEYDPESHCVSLCLPESQCFSLCLPESDCVSQSLIVSHCVSQSLIVSPRVSLCLTVSRCALESRCVSQSLSHSKCLLLNHCIVSRSLTHCVSPVPSLYMSQSLSLTHCASLPLSQSPCLNHCTSYVRRTIPSSTSSSSTYPISKTAQTWHLLK